MPVGSLDKAIGLEKNTEGAVRGQTVGHMNSDTGECETRQAEDVSNPDEGNDNSYEETHSNEGWIEDYERMSEATTWSGDASDKGISDNK